MLRIWIGTLMAFPFLVTPDHQADPQGPRFELDHFFVAVPAPESGSAALEEAGFLASPSGAHPGQGTASRGILFENAYLELIWLTNAEEAESSPIQRTRLRERLEPGSTACPFGIGLRRRGDQGVPLSFETWDYRPPYLPGGMSFQMGVNSANTEEPLVFLLPWISGPAWPAPDHPNGARRLTKLEIFLPGRPLDTATLSSLSEAGVATFLPAPEYFMDVELDGGRSGETLDLRPDIPFRISW